MRNSIRTACGRQIVIPARALAHLEAHPEVAGILPEAANRLVMPPRRGFVEAEVDMGRVVGRSGLVRIPHGSADTPMLFATRVGRPAPSRVVPDDTPCEETNKVVIVAQPNRDDDSTYALVTSWIGSLSHKEPWDRNIKTDSERQYCLRFWCSHALIHNPAVMGYIFESTWRDVLA
jgi:hypothetical protein